MSAVLTVFSPAKVNLHLAIGPRRTDGYHEACSVMHALTLHDTVTVRYEQDARGCDSSIEVRCATHGGVAPLDIPAEDNIAFKAIDRLLDAYGLHAGGHRFVVHIDKHIPHAAGLGGGSSNAAAALAAACRILNIDANDDRVAQVARSLGADVPFFLRGGCAVLGDRGDVFERALGPMKAPVVLVRPEEGVSTAAAYAAFDADPTYATEEDEQRLAAVDSACDVPFFNNLAAASERIVPELATVRSWLGEQPGVARDERTGAARVLLSGSGSATMCVCESMDAAYAIVAAAKRRGWWARSCSFSSAGARIIERARGGVRTNVGAVHKSW